jgi:phenylalanyl-tRNA synthetase beta subunit
MKIAVETLNLYLRKKRTTEEIVKLLEKTEIELEEVISGGKLDPKIILVKTLEVNPHPNADRLRLVVVTDGSKKIKVVCGAPNVVVNQRVGLVPPGAILPDGTKITTAKIRGEISQGMLASAKELGLSDDHSGIHVFEEDNHKLGTSLCDIVFSRDVLDIKTPANRWDYLSGVGIAREIAAYDDVQQVVEPSVGGYTYKNTEIVKVKAREGCKRFVSARLRVKNDAKSPTWLVDNLAANGIATHNPVVDITNFVMLETGQPSHAYDAQALSGPLEVRYAKKHEKITTLDDEIRALDEKDLVVCDKTGPIGLAGVMGGASTQITAKTSEIVLEAAHWDKTAVRKTALRHGLRTEASARFERSLPLPLPQKAFCRLLDLLIEICAAEVVEGPFDQLYAWPWQQFLGIRMRRAEKFLGMPIDEKQVMNHLRKLGYVVEHFSISKELKSHIGKPYRWGANYRSDGEEAFDCSYLVDRIYSKLGIFVGHTALGQFHNGRSVEVSELKPGDVLFYEGKIDKSVTDHYYLMNSDGTKKRYNLDKPEKVGHNGIYLGNGRVVQAAEYKYRQGKWMKRKHGGVIISPIEEFIENPKYLGARRYVESFNHILAVTVPWWRSDIRMEVDMYEEIAKIIGYDKMSETLPEIAPMSADAQSGLVAMRSLRQMLRHLGGTDVATYSFISEEDAGRTRLDSSQLAQISNPRSSEQKYLRSDMLASHLTMWQKNTVYKVDQIAFEISRVFVGSGVDGRQPQESWKLALSCYGDNALIKLQAYLHRFFESTDVRPIFKKPYKIDDKRMVRQRMALLYSDKELFGITGQVLTSICNSFDLVAPVSYAVMDINTFLRARQSAKLRSLPEYQLIQRDISLESNNDLSWQDITSTIIQNKNVVSWEYLNAYADKSLNDAGRRVITGRVRLDLGVRPSLESINKEVDLVIANLIDKYPQAKISSR